MQEFFVSLLPVILICVGIPFQGLAYQIPDINFERLPNGFRISIPDEKGIVRVAFNVNQNRPFTTFAQGDFNEQIRTPTNGRYVFELKRSFEDDDIIYVWISVQFNDLIYRKIAEPVVIGGGDNRTGNVTENAVGNTRQEKPIRGNENSGEKIDVRDEDQKVTVQQQQTLHPGCEPSLTRVTKEGQRYTPRCRGEEIFNEDFDNTVLNENIWTSEVRFPNDNCEDEFVLYNTSNVEIRNGQLNLRATLWDETRKGVLNLADKCTESFPKYCVRQPQGSLIIPPVVAARINTKSSFSFQYGRVVVRAKFPQGDWLYPLLLLEPIFVLINDPLPCFQTRIAFARGNQRLRINNYEDIGSKYLSGGLVFTENANSRNQFMVNKTSDAAFGSDFHIYEVIWDEESLIFNVDREQYGHIRIADIMSSQDIKWNFKPFRNPLDREFALTIGLAAGGHADFPDGSFWKPWTNTDPKAAVFFRSRRSTWLGNDPGITSVLYAVEKNEQCPSFYDYITSSEKRFWTTNRSERLKSGDRLSISTLVQKGEELYYRNEHIEIEQVGYSFTLSPNSIDFNKIATSFDQCELMKSYCIKSETIMSGADLCRDALIFEEEFNESPQLNPKYWSYDVSLRVNGDGDEEFVVFLDNTTVTFIKDGKLYIKPKLRDSIRKGEIELGSKCTSKGEECSIKADGARKFLPPVASAQISTKNSFVFRYGRVEIRAKIPKGDWIFPRLMLHAVDDTQPEISIAFAIGNTQNRNFNEQRGREKLVFGGEILTGGIIVWRNTSRGLKQATLRTKSLRSARHYGDDFHTYTLVWNRTSLTFGVDKHNYGTINQELSKDYYILLGVSIGGHLFFPDDSIGKPWHNYDHKAILNFWNSRKIWQPTWETSNALQVDYIRVFAI